MKHIPKNLRKGDKVVIFDVHRDHSVWYSRLTIKDRIDRLANGTVTYRISGFMLQKDPDRPLMRHPCNGVISSGDGYDDVMIVGGGVQ